MYFPKGAVCFAVLQLSFLKTYGHLNLEPKITCVSQFDYDYKTLQKCVETEHSLKDLEKTVEAQQKITDDLTEKQQKSTNMESSLEELMRTVKLQQQQIQDLTEKLSKIGERVSTSVSFTAIVSSPGLISLKPGETLIFDKVITNIGHAYDNLLGFFTAPVNGLYVFNMDIMVRAGQREYVQFIKNGKHVMWNYGHAPGAPHYVSSSRLVTLQLSSGDKVWIRTQTNDDHGDGVIHGNGFSTFSGWLIPTAA